MAVYYRFAIKEICYLHHDNAVQIRVNTYWSCHLWCHYTHHDVLKHPSSRSIRGLLVPWGVYFCFTGYNSVEQDEAGDTTQHTFTIPNWPICEYRNFIMTGTYQGVESYSCGPIFKHHNPGPEAENEESQLLGIHWSSISGGVGWGQKLFIPDRLVTSLSFQLSRFANPGGEVYFTISRVSDDIIIWQRKLMDAIYISPYPFWYSLSIDPPLLINEEVRIWTWATASGSTGNTSVYLSPADVKPNEHAFFRPASGIYREHLTWDYCYKYTYIPGFVCE